MYKTEKAQRLTFDGFNQSCGMKLQRADEWIRIADAIDWGSVEEKYIRQLKSKAKRGRPVVSARVALGSLIIQQRMGLSDRNLVKEIARNPYYQYFIGLESYQTECPIKHGVLSEPRKRVGVGFINAVNEQILAKSAPTNEHAREKPEKPAANGNLGTMILDAACSPSNIRFPQDFSLLNEARVKLDKMIDSLHTAADEGRRPRTYRKVLRKKFLTVAKTKKRTKKLTRSIVRVMLCAVRRNLAFVDGYIARGFGLDDAGNELLNTIRTLCAQQKEMFDTGTHRIEKRIVSVTQPFVRPIVRGKTKAPVGFGAKYDVSVDELGHARLEQISFEPYNECTILKDAIERYKNRTGHYPARVLVDLVYRTKENLDYCAEHGVKISGRRPGALPKDPKERRKAERKIKKNDTDRIEVERFFSRDKRTCGAGLIMTKLSDTTLGSIALAVLVANLFGALPPVSFLFYFMDAPDGRVSCHLLEIVDDAA